MASSVLSEQRVGSAHENGQKESQRLGGGHCFCEADVCCMHETFRGVGCAQELGKEIDGSWWNSRTRIISTGRGVLQEQGSVLSFKKRVEEGTTPGEENSQPMRWNDDRLMCSVEYDGGRTVGATWTDLECQGGSVCGPDRGHRGSQSRGCCSAVGAASVASRFSEAQKQEAQVTSFSP